MQNLITQASDIAGICLYFVAPMTDGCVLCTDSGSRKRYVVGRLDDGSVFCERAVFDG
jgi:hypothetical protein